MRACASRQILPIVAPNNAPRKRKWGQRTESFPRPEHQAQSHLLLFWSKSDSSSLQTAGCGACAPLERYCNSFYSMDSQSGTESIDSFITAVESAISNCSAEAFSKACDWTCYRRLRCRGCNHGAIWQRSDLQSRTNHSQINEKSRGTKIWHPIHDSSGTHWKIYRSCGNNQLQYVKVLYLGWGNLSVQREFSGTTV